MVSSSLNRFQAWSDFWLVGCISFYGANLLVGHAAPFLNRNVWLLLLFCNHYLLAYLPGNVWINQKKKKHRFKKNFKNHNKISQ